MIYRKNKDDYIDDKSAPNNEKSKTVRSKKKEEEPTVTDS